MSDLPPPSESSVYQSNFSVGTVVFGLILGSVVFGATYGLCLLTNDEAALARGIPQDTALWTGLCVALGTIWVSLAHNVTRQAIRMGIIVGLVSGMMLDGMGSPAWLAIGLPTLLGLLVFWLHRKKEDVDNIGVILS